MDIESLFLEPIKQKKGVWVISESSGYLNQNQTNEVFSDKWERYSKEDVQEQERTFDFQKNWYLELYNFEAEVALRSFLETKKVILDAGCGLGYKSKWFADLSPNSHVLGMDFSDSIYIAQERYSETKNLSFIKGDISDTKFRDKQIDYVSCDQVIHHTEDPQLTMKELSRILVPGGELAVYVYAKKALPRELLDDHFRLYSLDLDKEQLWEMSAQLTELGKRLSQLKVSLDVPDIPLLGIKGGNMDIQRFLYWNFLKCF